MIELERTYLAKSLPEGYKESTAKEIIDIYIPSDIKHPCLRIRKNEDKCEITKKIPVEGKDSSKQLEHTIPLTEKEYFALAAIPSKKVRKIRYYYEDSEIDVFQDDLAGLVLIDFEFVEEADKENFKMPDFCLADVTQEKFVAGGMLAGKSYADIENQLNQYGYQKLEI